MATAVKGVLVSTIELDLHSAITARKGDILNVNVSILQCHITMDIIS